MDTDLTITSTNAEVLRLVEDFARGLGCNVGRPAAHDEGIQITLLPSDTLVELLTHVALSALKAGVDVSEPRCQLTYRHGGARSNVTLLLRVGDFSITPRDQSVP